MNHFERWKVSPFPNLFTHKSHAELIEKSVKLGQGQLTQDGALAVKTGKHTGRSAKDKYIVETESTKKSIWWENTINRLSSENFEKLLGTFQDYLSGKEEVFHSSRSVGAHAQYYANVDVVSTYPHHALFSDYLFREKRPHSEHDFLILHAPHLELEPEKYGLHSSTVIATCFDRKITLIAGTEYAGEIKKSMFCVLNYILPEFKVLPMHSGCSQNDKGESFVFFGLSGTGKTTLSTDEDTYLVGDDEHGIDDKGVFNFEGGCYAKTFELSAKGEPDIYAASNRFGGLLENVVLNEERKPQFADKSISENGRSSYPLTFIERRIEDSRSALPKHLFFLTADAFGVLPPVSKLTQQQAMFYFVLGYTAKLAGTEIGVQSPQATFSACFGAPFMMRHPSCYANLLGDYLANHNINVWLINTGWTAGPYGKGHRFPLETTRAIIRAIQTGKLEDGKFQKEDIFGLEIPASVPGVKSEMLSPWKTWSDRTAYDKQANQLAQSFKEQMNKFETSPSSSPQL